MPLRAVTIQSFLLMICLKHIALVLRRSFFEIVLIDERSGFISFTVTGNSAKKIFQNECGGHRWQRIPPTEKRGRIQTSTVTVAVLDPLDVTGAKLDLNDVEFSTTKGSGPGGQNRNTTDSCVIAIHKPSGMVVRIDNERSQHQNKATALNVLAARLYESAKNEVILNRQNARKSQIGSGMRGDKIRTYRSQDNYVIDNRTNKKHKLSKWLKGNWEW